MPFKSKTRMKRYLKRWRRKNPGYMHKWLSVNPTYKSYWRDRYVAQCAQKRAEAKAACLPAAPALTG